MARLARHLRRVWRAVGSARYETRHRFWDLRRAAVRWITDPALARLLAQFRANVARRDWGATLASAQRIASIAERQHDAKLLEEMGKALWLLGEHRRGVQLRLASRRLRGVPRANEWQGEDLTGRSLLIDLMETAKQGLSHAFLNASLVAQAARKAGRIAAIVEPRIVPLYRRSFPNAEILPAGPAGKAAYASADLVAGALHLSEYFSPDAAAIAANFVPLVPDTARVDGFRVKYPRPELPRIGVSWASSAFGKDVPSIDDWANFVRATNATFVSLQYGEVEPDLAKLRLGNRERVVHDADVDQMVDMDLFAAQVASLDAVVSISNTAAHLAGALGVPTIVIPDDRLRLWPVFGNPPWYPRTVLVRKEGRSWATVMQDVATRLRALPANAARRRADPVSAEAGAQNR